MDCQPPEEAQSLDEVFVFDVVGLGLGPSSESPVRFRARGKVRNAMVAGLGPNQGEDEDTGPLCTSTTESLKRMGALCQSEKDTS